MRIFSIWILTLLVVAKAQEYRKAPFLVSSVYTPVDYTLPVEVEDGSGCSVAFWNKPIDEQGQSGDLSRPYHVVALGDTGPPVNRCATYEVQSYLDGTPFKNFYFIVAAWQTLSSDEYAVHPKDCTIMCDTPCTAGESLPAGCTMEGVLYGKLDTYEPESATPPIGVDECGSGHWTNNNAGNNIGGSGLKSNPANAVLVGTRGFEGQAEPKCGHHHRIQILQRLTNGATWVERFVVIAGYRESSSIDFSISQSLCNKYCSCNFQCVWMPDGVPSATPPPLTTPEPPTTTTTDPTTTTTDPTTTTTEEETTTTEEETTTTEEETTTTEEETTTTEEETTTAEEETSTTEEETMKETTTDSPRSANAEVFMWGGPCNESSCGNSVEWSERVRCGSELRPCYAKVVGHLELPDSRDDSTIAVPVECGQVLAVTGTDAGTTTFIHVVSFEPTDDVIGSLHVSDMSLLGECRSICRDTGTCGTDCGDEERYEDCKCNNPTDATDASCNICGRCSNEVTGLVRGALDNNLSVFVSAVVVNWQEPGRDHGTCAALGLAAASLMVL